jgi:hypothetical protein
MAVFLSTGCKAVETLVQLYTACLIPAENKSDSLHPVVCVNFFFFFFCGVLSGSKRCTRFKSPGCVVHRQDIFSETMSCCVMWSVRGCTL